MGGDTQLGSDKLRTLLMLVHAQRHDRLAVAGLEQPARQVQRSARGPDSNLRLPLWQLVRASTAAPTYFPPETIEVGDRPFVFVDGGVTMYNNPAFQLFLMATLAPYSLCWPAGQDKMLLVSVGTGTSPNANADLAPGEMNLLYNAVVHPLGADVRRAQRAGLPLPRVRRDALRRRARS